MQNKPHESKHFCIQMWEEGRGGWPIGVTIRKVLKQL